MAQAPAVAFLGFCERAALLPDGPLQKINALGLRQFVASFIYPLPLRGALLLALYDPADLAPFRLEIRSQMTGEILMFSDFGQSAEYSASDNPVVALEKQAIDSSRDAVKASVLLPHGRPVGWIPFIVPLPECVVSEPGEYSVVMQHAGQETTLGWLVFLLATPPPLTPDRARAIAANGAKVIRATYQCKKCGDSLKMYCSISRHPTLEQKGFTWYEDLAEEFHCRCGATRHSLLTIRSNVHGLLGISAPFEGMPLWSAEYEQSVLQLTCQRFAELLDSKPREEDVQVFIEQNTSMLASLGAERLFFKKPITTKYVSDIAIVNGKRELILIELERPDIKLMRKDGAIASELQHALGQVDDWLLTADRNRQAVLDCLDLRAEDVASISGLIVAGRDRACSEAHLTKLQWLSFGNKRFMTYDELLRNGIALVRHLQRL